MQADEPVSILVEEIQKRRVEVQQGYGRTIGNYPSETRENLNRLWNGLRSRYNSEYRKRLRDLTHGYELEQSVIAEGILELNDEIANIDSIPEDGSDFEYDAHAVEMFLTSVPRYNVQQIIQSTQAFQAQLQLGQTEQSTARIRGSVDKSHNVTSSSHRTYTSLAESADPKSQWRSDSIAERGGNGSPRQPSKDETAEQEGLNGSEALLDRIRVNLFTPEADIVDALLSCSQLSGNTRAAFKCRPGHNWIASTCPCCKLSLWEAARITVPLHGRTELQVEFHQLIHYSCQ